LLQALLVFGRTAGINAEPLAVDYQTVKFETNLGFAVDVPAFLASTMRTCASVPRGMTTVS
jgi:hypothetical protein